MRVISISSKIDLEKSILRVAIQLPDAKDYVVFTKKIKVPKVKSEYRRMMMLLPELEEFTKECKMKLGIIR